MLRQLPEDCKQKLTNFHSFSSFEWIGCAGFYSFARSSPGKPSKYSHDWHRHLLKRELTEVTGREPTDHVDEVGVHGDRITLTSRPGLSRIVALAMGNRFPIVSFDWTRFGTTEKVLLKLNSTGVQFVTVQPFGIAESSFHGERVSMSKLESKRQRMFAEHGKEFAQMTSRYFKIPELDYPATFAT